MQLPGGASGLYDLRGQRLGAYEVIKFIGRGGMAVVYRARQPALGRDVAIKLLPPYYLHHPDFRARFEREARTAARLEHPHILPIYDFGQAGDMPYIVMRLVETGTLRDWLDQGAPLARALPVFRGILSALNYAHSCQPPVIHRDINPKNVLMAPGDWPLLADFGIAKILEPTPGTTGPGTMIGTPEYIAPEQSQGAPVDHRADIYAMGVLLFEILTGRKPFQGATPLSVVLQHVGAEVPSVRTFKPDLPAVWDEVIQRSLAKTPADRYPSAQAMDEAIESAWQQTPRREQMPVATGPGPGPVSEIRPPAQAHFAGAFVRRLWPRRGAFLVAIALLVLFAAFVIANVGTRRQPTAVPAALAPVRIYVAENGNNRVAVLNPLSNTIDTTIPVGTRPGLVAGNAAGTRVYVANNGGDTVSIIDTRTNSVLASVPVGASPFGVAVVPDGGHVYVGNAGSLERPDNTVSVIDTATNEVVHTVLVGSGPAGLAASPDASHVYVANNDSSSVSVIDTATNTVAATVPVGARPAGVAVSPDGRRVYVANAGDDTVSVLDTVSTRVLATVPAGARPSGLAVHPDGRRVYVANEEADSVSVLDTDSNRVIATLDVGPRPFDVAVSPEGSRVFVTTYGDRSVTVIDTENHAVLARVRVGVNPLGVGVKP